MTKDYTPAPPPETTKPKRTPWIIAIAVLVALGIGIWVVANHNATQLAEARMAYQAAIFTDQQTIKAATSASTAAGAIHEQTEDKVLDNQVRVDLELVTTQLADLYVEQIFEPNTDSRKELILATASLKDRETKANDLIPKVEAAIAANDLAMDKYLLSKALETNQERRNEIGSLVTKAEQAIANYDGKIATSVFQHKAPTILESTQDLVDKVNEQLTTDFSRETADTVNRNTESIDGLLVSLLELNLEELQSSHDRWKEQQSVSN